MKNNNTTTVDTLLDEIPARVDSNQILNIITNGNIDNSHLVLLKDLTGENDEEISKWLNVTPKTLRSYKLADSLKSHTKEQIVILLSLFKHGKDVFGTVESFLTWLSKPNFFFDNKAPQKFLNTISGVQFIDDRITGMEYGDNA